MIRHLQIPVKAEEGKRPLDSQAALERWQAWNEDEATDTDSSSSLQNISSSCDASEMEHALGLNSEKLKLEGMVDGKSFANSDHQPRTEELQMDAQDPAPGVQQYEILGPAVSPNTSAEGEV